MRNKIIQEALRIAKMLAEKFQKAAGFQIDATEFNGNNIPDNSHLFYNCLVLMIHWVMKAINYP